MNNEKRIKRSVYLFPNYFKKIGVLLILLSIIIFVVETQEIYFLFDEEYSLPIIFLLIGLALINFSKEKKEDERVRRIRYVTWSYSFYLIIFWVILGKIFSFAFDSVQLYNSSVSLLLLILTMNILFFEANKEMDVDEE